MKLLSSVLLVLLLASAAIADDISSFVFAGVEYDSDARGFTSTIGAGTRVAGGLWNVSRTVIGRYGSLEPDLVYFVGVPQVDHLYLGLVAGPNMDWYDQPGDGIDPTFYIAGASGLLLNYRPDGWGITIGAKYKFAFDTDSFYPDGWQGGVWVSYAL